jgi:hypothetical protein
VGGDQSPNSKKWGGPVPPSPPEIMPMHNDDTQSRFSLNAHTDIIRHMMIYLYIPGDQNNNNMLNIDY